MKGKHLFVLPIVALIGLGLTGCGEKEAVKPVVILELPAVGVQEEEVAFTYTVDQEDCVVEIKLEKPDGSIEKLEASSFVPQVEGVYRVSVEAKNAKDAVGRASHSVSISPCEMQLKWEAMLLDVQETLCVSIPLDLPRPDRMMPGINGYQNNGHYGLDAALVDQGVVFQDLVTDGQDDPIWDTIDLWAQSAVAFGYTYEKGVLIAEDLSHMIAVGFSDSEKDEALILFLAPKSKAIVDASWAQSVRKAEEIIGMELLLPKLECGAFVWGTYDGFFNDHATMCIRLYGTITDAQISVWYAQLEEVGYILDEDEYFIPPSEEYGIYFANFGSAAQPAYMIAIEIFE